MNCVIERSSSVPVYLQIKKQIREYMETRRVKPGDRLPTDEEFCNMFGVSRMTARKAVSALVAERLITRVRGKGTFVGEGHGRTPAQGTGVIGVVMPGLAESLDSEHSPTHYETMCAIEEFFSTRKHNLNILTSRSGPLAPETLQQIPASGFIMLFPEEHDRKIVEVLTDCGAPFVAVNCFFDSDGFNRVNTDVIRAGREAAEYLIKKGRRRIAFIANETFRGGGLWHYRGYELGMRAAGLQPVLRTIDRSTLENDFASRYPMMLDGVDGIVAADDAIAVAVLEQAADAGVRVPDDIAIVGYFDKEICEKVSPTLTSFRPSGYPTLGRKGAERLLEIMHGKASEPSLINLEVEMIVRESSG